MATTDPVTHEPRQFSIHMPRPLWIGAATVVFLVASVGFRIGLPIYRQQVTIREIERVGGTVHFDKAGPEWLRELLGDERMRCVDAIRYVRFRPRLKTFRQRPVLEGILYSGPPRWTESSVEIDDSLLKCIRNVPDLKQLSLSRTNIGDPGVVHIASLTDLETLDISGTDVSDASIPLFKRMRKLKELRLFSTQITDKGATDLKQALPQLTIEH
jgi:hypothetical protein